MLLTANDIITEVQTRAQLTGGTNGLDNNTILDLASFENETSVFPLITSLQKGFCLYTENLSVTANTNRVRIPERCFGNVLDNLYWTDGTTTSRIDVVSLDKLENWVLSTGTTPQIVIFEGNYMRLFPVPSTAGTLVVTYVFRPSYLVTNDQAATILTINTGARQVTVNTVPTVFTTTAVYDAINQLSGNEVILHDLPVTSIVGSTITFGADISALSVGNWLSLAKTAPVITQPEETHLLVLYQTVARIQQMLNDQLGYSLTQDKIKELRAQLEVTLTRRVAERPISIGGGNPFLPRRTIGVW